MLSEHWAIGVHTETLQRRTNQTGFLLISVCVCVINEYVIMSGVKSNGQQ